MCTFANSENSSYFVVLYNIRKKKTMYFSENIQRNRMYFLICKSTLSENGGLGRGDEKEKIEIQNQRYRSRRNVL